MLSSRQKKLPARILLFAFMVSALIPFMYMLATAMTPQAFTLPYPAMRKLPQSTIKES